MDTNNLLLENTGNHNSTNEKDSQNLKSNSEESTQPKNEETNNGSGRKHQKKDNRRIANLKRTKSQKERKSERLVFEIDSHKADIDRGYLIVQLGDDSEKIKHVQLEISDREMIRSVIAEKEYIKYELSLDIAEIDLKIRELASAKKTSYKDKLNRIRQEKKENDLVKRVSKELDSVGKSGSNEVVLSIKDQLVAGNKTEAYKSLKSFLSQEVNPVAKKLSKSKVLEKNVLKRVLDKLAPVQL